MYLIVLIMLLTLIADIPDSHIDLVNDPANGSVEPVPVLPPLPAFDVLVIEDYMIFVKQGLHCPYVVLKLVPLQLLNQKSVLVANMVHFISQGIQNAQRILHSIALIYGISAELLGSRCQQVIHFLNMLPYIFFSVL